MLSPSITSSLQLGGNENRPTLPPVPYAPAILSMAESLTRASQSPTHLPKSMEPLPYVCAHVRLGDWLGPNRSGSSTFNAEAYAKALYEALAKALASVMPETSTNPIEPAHRLRMNIPLFVATQRFGDVAPALSRHFASLYNSSTPFHDHRPDDDAQGSSRPLRYVNNDHRSCVEQTVCERATIFVSSRDQSS